MLRGDTLSVGTTATILTLPRFHNRRRCYRSTVRVLDIRKHTARVEMRRYDGTTKRRFVKLNRLVPGTR